MTSTPTVTPETPRCCRNNNPGNIDCGQSWRGLVPRPCMTPAQAAEDRFAVFQGPEWGFRAMAILLRNYLTYYGCNTVRKIINRWAPSGENNTSAYVADVSTRMGVKPDDRLNLVNDGTLFKLVKAITIHETGCWEPYWNDAQLEQGLKLAAL